MQEVCDLTFKMLVKRLGPFGVKVTMRTGLYGAGDRPMTEFHCDMKAGDRRLALGTVLSEFDILRRRGYTPEQLAGELSHRFAADVLLSFADMLSKAPN